MGWVRVSDDFYDDRKFDELSALGIATWIMGLAYANRNLTDGFVPRRTAVSMVNVEKLGIAHGVDSWLDANGGDGVIELLESGIWEVVEGGYMIHNYLKYQKSKAEIEEISAKRSASGRHGGLASVQAKQQANGKQKSTPNPNPNPSTSNEVETVTPFDQFWEAWPRKVAEPTASKAFDKALQIASFSDIMAGVVGMQRYAEARGDLTFVPHPATWLNQQRWNDQVVLPQQPSTPTTRMVDAVNLGAQMDARSHAELN